VGVSIYIMPLETYLSGNFRTTWERQAESAGSPGFRISGQGLEGPPPRPRRSEDDVRDWIRAFRVAGLDSLGFTPEWDGDGPVLAAVTMSYSGFAGPALAARRYAARLRGELLRSLEPPVILLPEAFDELREFPSPDGEDDVIAVGSSARLEEELGGLQSMLENDPKMEELAGLCDGSVVTGLLYDFHQEMEVTRRLRGLAALSLEHRLPVIVEG
jgi:hypothetical protein